jgi:hypothetical protein
MPYQLQLHQLVYETLAGSSRPDRARLFAFFHNLGDQPHQPHDRVENVSGFDFNLKLVGQFAFLYCVDHPRQQIRVAMSATRIAPNPPAASAAPAPSASSARRSPRTRAAFSSAGKPRPPATGG